MPVGGHLDVPVTFKPTAGGRAVATVTLSDDDATGIGSFQLVGTGQAVGPVATVAVLNNNLGGAYAAGGAAVGRSDFATIRNDGSQPLLIRSVTVTDGATSFALTGLPADLSTNPVQVAAAGRSRSGRRTGRPTSA